MSISNNSSPVSPNFSGYWKNPTRSSSDTTRTWVTELHKDGALNKPASDKKAGTAAWTDKIGGKTMLLYKRLFPGKKAPTTAEKALPPIPRDSIESNVALISHDPNVTAREPVNHTFFPKPKSLASDYTTTSTPTGTEASSPIQHIASQLAPTASSAKESKPSLQIPKSRFNK